MTAMRAGRNMMGGFFLLALAGCSGGLPDMPSMPSMPSLPSLSALAEESPPAQAEEAKPKAEVKPVNFAEMLQPGLLGDKVLGKPNAPVTIVEYASLTCPVCAKFHNETLAKLKKAYIDKGKVKLIYREFPIGHSAAAAAMAVRCAPDKDYFKVVDKFYATQSAWVAQEVKTEEIYKVVQGFGVKRDKFDGCLTNQSINDALVLVKQRGRGYGVTGTPTFWINGKKVAGGVSFEEMQAVIEAELNAPKPAAEQPNSQQKASGKAA